MSSCNTFPDIIGICETKRDTNSNMNLIPLENYNLHFVNSETRSGGALVYIKKSILYRIRQDLKFTCREYDTLWLEVSVGINSNNSKNILVRLIYRHPGKSIQGFSKKISEVFI